MAKGIVPRVLYLVLIMLIMISLLIMVTGGTFTNIIDMVTGAHCVSRVNSYCDECKKGQCPSDWEEYAPGCKEKGINEPTLEECGITPVLLEDCTSQCQAKGYAEGNCRGTIIEPPPTNGKVTHGIMHAPGDAFLDKMWDDSNGEFTDKFKLQIDQIADISIDFFYLTFHAGNGEKSFWKTGDKSTLRSECEVIDRDRANPFTGQMTERCKRFLDKTIPYILDKDMKVTLYMWLRGSDTFWNWLGRDSNSIDKIEEYVIPFWKTLTQYLKDKNYPYDKVILGPIFGNVGSGWGWPGYFEQEAVDWWTPIMKKVVDEIHTVDPNRIIIASPMPDFSSGRTMWEYNEHGGEWLPIGPADTVWYRVMVGKTQGGGTLEPVSNEPCKANYDTDPSKNEYYPIEEGEIGIAWHQNQYGVTVVTEELKPFQPFIREKFCPNWDWEYRKPEAYDWLREWLPKRDEIGVGWMWEGANGFRTWLGESFFNDDGSEKPFVDIIRDYLQSSKSSPTSSKFLAKTVTWGDGITETVQVGDKGEIYLNGKEVFAFGLNIIKGRGLPTDVEANKMLDWLQQKGVRFMALDMENTWNDPDLSIHGEMLNFWMPKLYAHKMFVTIPIQHRGEEPPALDVDLQYAKIADVIYRISANSKWSDMVFSMGMTWELSLWFTDSELETYLNQLYPKIRTKIDSSALGHIPLYNKGTGTDGTQNRGRIPIAKYSDFPAIDFYIGQGWEYHIDKYMKEYRETVLSEVGKLDYKVAFTEFGWGTEDSPVEANNINFPTEYFQNIVAGGPYGNIVQGYFWDLRGTYNRDWSAFDDYGNPKPWIQRLAPYFPQYETTLSLTESKTLSFSPGSSFKDSIVWENGFEDGDDTFPGWDDYYEYSLTQPSSTTTSTEKVRTGDYGAKFTMEDGDKSEDARRLGLFVHETGVSEVYQDGFYYSFWMYVPDNIEDMTDNHITIGGIKWYFNRYQWSSGARWAFIWKDGKVKVQLHVGPHLNSGSCTEGKTETYCRADGVTYYYGDMTDVTWYHDINYGAWNHFQIYLKSRTDNTGVLKAWVNDDLLETVSGVPTHPNGFLDPSQGASFFSQGNVYPHPQLMYYVDRSSAGGILYVDDAVIATEKVPETYGVGEPYGDGPSFKEKVLWENSFETIDDYYGPGYYSISRGDNLGGWDKAGMDDGAEIFKSTEKVRTGSYSWKGVHSKIDSEVKHTNILLESSDDPSRSYGQVEWDEAYYSWWYYFPEDFEFAPSGSGHWFTIGGLINYWCRTDLVPDCGSGQHGSWKMRFGVSTRSETGDFVRVVGRIGGDDMPEETKDMTFDSVDIPVGTWVQLQTYWKVDKDNGAYEYFINGKSIGRKEGVCTDPRYCGDRFPGGDPEGPMYPTFVMDFYTGAWFPYEGAPTPYNVYIDDAVVASEFVPLDYHPGEAYENGDGNGNGDDGRTGCYEDETLITNSCFVGYSCCCSGKKPKPAENIFGVEIWTHAADYYLQKTKELSVGWARIGNSGNWKIIEYEKGKYHWDSADRMVNWAKDNGIKPYITVGYTPDWATSKEPYNKANPPDDMNDYKNFVYTIVNRYDLDVVNLWNGEPHGFFGGTQDEWVALIKAGSEGAKEANPNIIVTAGYGYSIRHIYDSDFPLDDLVQKGFLNYIDALDVHTYTGNTNPEDVLPERLDNLRDYLTAHGKGDMDIYASEFGYAIAPGTPAGGSHTLEEQADWTVKHAEILSNDPYVKLVIYWPLHGDAGNVYSLIDTDTDEPRPVYYAYKDFIAETTPPPTETEFRPLHIDGRYVKNDLGETVLLRGISGPSPWWWDVHGDGVEETLGYAKDWDVNVYRLSLSWSSYYEDGWLRPAVEEAIDAAKELGIYVIVGEWSSTEKSEPELGWSKLKQYWERFASEHKDDWHILYNILNEPRDDGSGRLTRQKYQDYMEETTDLIRKHVPDAVIVIDGLREKNNPEGNSLTSLEFLKTNPIRRDNILYDVHVYGGPPWDVIEKIDKRRVKWATENGYAVFIGETNVFAGGDTSYWWEEDGVWVTSQEGIDWFDATLTEFDNRQLGYAAWAFIPRNFPPLMKDWHGTPNQAGDVLIKHLKTTVPTDGDWGFIPEGYEIVFSEDVEDTTWDGSTGDNPNFQPWVDFFTNVHDNADIDHKQAVVDDGGKWYGDGDDWYSTAVKRRGNRAFRVNRDGQYPDEGDRMTLWTRFHTEYVWYGTWIYFPEDFELVDYPADTNKWFTFGGTFESKTIDGDNYQVFNELTMMGESMKVYVNYRKLVNNRAGSREGGLLDTGIELAPYRGQWVHIGFIYHWSTGDGFMDIYFNGQKMVRLDKTAPNIVDDATRWKADRFLVYTMKHYSHELDYETVYWDDLVFAVPEGTDW